MVRAWITALVLGTCGLASAPGTAAPVDFARHIRPMLLDRCFKCHGPDAATREAELRLDRKDELYARRGDAGFVVKPSDRAGSILFQRVSSDDPDQRMPPPSEGGPLTAEEIGLIGLWIDQGAPASLHWAYQPLRRPPLPTVKHGSWSRNPVDRFTLAEMGRRGFLPSEEADKRTLARRVTLDLTGLPPTPDEIAEFLADQQPGAFERLVERLLGSPRFGERMATLWLDLARYADTHGYHMDAHRDMWPWRDWVVKAYNGNMPFDQFTVEQLAGDLLPNATLSQRIATGFNRNNMVNFENGIIAEEFRTEYVVDRVVTTSTVWLGQTLACARCHDHKYDPFSQRDFYRMFALFNNVPENGVDGDKGNAAPFIQAPTEQQETELVALQRRLTVLEKVLVDHEVSDGKRRVRWEAEARDAHTRPPAADPIVYASLNASEDGGHRTHVPGKVGAALLFDESSFVDLGRQADFDAEQSFTISLWLFPTTHDSMTVLQRRSHEEPSRGYSIALEDGHIVFDLVHTRETQQIRTASREPVALRKWQHLGVKYDGSSRASGVAFFVNGRTAGVEHRLDTLTATTKSDASLVLGSTTPGGSFRGMLDEMRIYDRMLTNDEIEVLAGGDPIGDILAIERGARTKEQEETLRRYYQQYLLAVDPTYQRLSREMAAAERKLAAIQNMIPTAMVMQELSEPRGTQLLIRGRYDQPGDRIEPGVPQALAFDNRQVTNRLQLARWLVHPEHPLTSRVEVNRLWQRFFGNGLVRTPEDFGLRGALPTHPEMLDWLAVEFIESGWDVKRLVRLLVTSATYRQSSSLRSSTPPRLVAEYSKAEGRHREPLDPENVWLARAPRLFFDAETVRDAALASSGLPVERVGGPPVFPYQPEGLWEAISYNPDDFTAQVYRQSHGADLYRRSLYTFWKRSAPLPTLASFGAPTRETCTVQRSRTRTPQQALTLMNDPTFVEAAVALAALVMSEPRKDASSRIESLFERVLSRRPGNAETQVLAALYEDARREYTGQPELASELRGSGESIHSDSLGTTELAAWTIVASTILSLEEAVTRN